jgi:glycosyltransferase involved in cell wall biosynthesis
MAVSQHRDPQITDLEVTAVPLEQKRLSLYVSALVGLLPIHAARFRSKLMEDRVVSELNSGRYDLIWCHHLQTSVNLPVSELPLVLDQHNCDEHYWQELMENSVSLVAQLAAAVNLRAVRRFQLQALPRFDLILSVSEEERRRTAKSIAEPDRVWVVPNGVAHVKPRDLLNGERPPIVLFCGSMHLRKNAEGAAWFARSVFPLIRQHLHQAEFWIVGGHPRRGVARLGCLPGVRVFGWVPDVARFYERAGLVAVPVQIGGGTKIKVLDALSHSLPVVSTSVGIDGLDLVSGEHVFVANDASTMADLIVKILSGALNVGDVVESAIDLIRRKYLWSMLYGEVSERILELR